MYDIGNMVCSSGELISGITKARFTKIGICAAVHFFDPFSTMCIGEAALKEFGHSQLKQVACSDRFLVLYW